MKILLLSVHPPQGGGSAHSSQELAWGLRGLGHEVIHLAPYRSETDRPHYPDLIWFPADFPDTLQISPAAQQVMDRYVQQIYQQYGHFDWVILGRESFLWQIPSIRAVHRGSIALALRSNIAVIVRGAYINKLVGTEAVEPQLREKLVNLYRSCDRIICIAEHLVTSVQKVIGKAPITFLPNPIDLSAFQAISCRKSELGKPIQILMAAQLKARKRPLDAIKIMHLLIQKGVDCYLTICGDGVDRDQVIKLIQTYGLEQRISLKGKLERKEVVKHLEETDIVLLCSDNEGRPRVLQEAIAAGKAIVAYDNPGSREVINSWIEPWKLGRLVAIGDTIAAVEAIIELVQLLQQNPSITLQIPSSQQILTQYETLLQELITQL